jgi:hypothetical protein
VWLTCSRYVHRLVTVHGLTRQRYDDYTLRRVLEVDLSAVDHPPDEARKPHLMMLIGVDPHKSTHTATALDPATNSDQGSIRIDASHAGYRKLLDWARQWPERTWAVENAEGLVTTWRSGWSLPARQWWT